jgi:hypothetical protein
MLNPRSPYRLFEWHVFWPLGALLGDLHVFSRDKFRRLTDTGISAYPEPAFRELLTNCGLSATDVIYYDINFLVPPFDDYVRRLTGQLGRRRWESTVGRNWRRFFGTAYLAVAVPV